MKDDINMTLAKRMETLIVDGQKEVLSEIHALRDEMRGGQDELRGGQDELKEGQKRLEVKIDAVHSSLKQEIKTTSGILDFGISQLDAKLEAHLRVPHAA